MEVLTKQISPLDLGHGPVSELGPKPVLEWIELKRLIVNPLYQRGLNKHSLAQIRKIAREFDWTKIRALSVVKTSDEGFEVIDGQHTATAAASRGDITHLPCLVIDRGLDVSERAKAFVGINTDRVGVSQLQLFWSGLAAKDQECWSILKAVKDGGGRIPKGNVSGGTQKVGDVFAIAALRRVVRKGGARRVRLLTELGIRCELAPITSDFLDAFTLLLWAPEYGGSITTDEITDVVTKSADLAERVAILRSTSTMSKSVAMASAIADLAEAKTK